MPIKVGINGYGRIGRNILRALYESKRNGELQIVAINDLGDAQTNAHLTRYDTAHGKFPGEVKVDGDSMVVNGDRIRVLAERDPSRLPWGSLGAEFILECTGLFSSRAKASGHLQGGAKKVVISAPGGEDVDATIVYGVNHQVLKASYSVISNASCTTNCLATAVKPIVDELGWVKGFMTTIHSYTNDQVILDFPHKDLRRARAAAISMIPTSTGAAKALRLVIPELDGKLDGSSMRVPTPNVSVVNAALKKASESGPLKGYLGYEENELVSADFKGDGRSSIVDAPMTRVVAGSCVKVISWYDNEWGYSSRVRDLINYMAGKGL